MIAVRLLWIEIINEHNEYINESTKLLLAHEICYDALEGGFNNQTCTARAKPKGTFSLPRISCSMGTSGYFTLRTRFTLRSSSIKSVVDCDYPFTDRLDVCHFCGFYVVEITLKHSQWVDFTKGLSDLFEC